MSRVAVVGGGVAGLSAAWRLGRHAETQVTVFESAQLLGGRVSTVERGPMRFDDGAQFVRTETPLARTALLEELPSDSLVDVRRDVRPFNHKAEIGAGDPAQNAEPKWVYRDGLRTLPYLLARAGAPRVQLGWQVTKIAADAGGWTVCGTDREATGFDAVLLTCPPAAMSRLLERSALPRDFAEPLRAAFAATRHRSIISVAFEPSKRIEAPEHAYALVNTDRKHEVSWLAFEEAKPGYVHEGRPVIVAQMAHGWSAGRLADPDRDITHAAARSAGSLLGSSLTPRWAYVTRWPEALPDVLVPADADTLAEGLGLFLAGDTFTGGRVHLALESGLAAGDRIADYLSNRK